MKEVHRLIQEAESRAEYWDEIARLDFAYLLNDRLEDQEESRKGLSEKSGISLRYLKEILGGDAVNLTLSTMSRLMYELGDRLMLYYEPIRKASGLIEIGSGWKREERKYEQPEYREDTGNIESCEVTME